MIDVSNKEYRSMEGISSTDLKRMVKSMASYKWFKDNPEDSDSSALLFGRAYHKLVLEPSDFDTEFIVSPKFDRRTKEGKEAYSNFLKDAEGKDVIDEEMYQQICDMRDVLYSTPFAKKLLDGTHEKSFFWDDTDTGIKCKCRPDSFGKVGKQYICVDLKTTSNASTDKFMKSALDFGYDIQAAHYCEGLKAEYGQDFTFVFVAQEKTAPYLVNILQADEYFMKSGYDTRKSLLEQYNECVKRNEYPGLMGFNDEASINSISLPQWLLKYYEEENIEEEN